VVRRGSSPSNDGCVVLSQCKEKPRLQPTLEPPAFPTWTKQMRSEGGIWSSMARNCFFFLAQPGRFEFTHICSYGDWIVEKEKRFVLSFLFEERRRRLANEEAEDDMPVILFFSMGEKV